MRKHIFTLINSLTQSLNNNAFSSFQQVYVNILNGKQLLFAFFDLNIVITVASNLENCGIRSSNDFKRSSTNSIFTHFQHYHGMFYWSFICQK